jgi:hypothetical protein
MATERSESFRRAYRDPDREGVTPFVEEWGEELMILKKVESLRLEGLSLMAACREVRWSLWRYVRARWTWGRAWILSAPRRPRIGGDDDDAAMSLAAPMRSQHIHPDGTSYSPYPTSLDHLRQLYTFNAHRRRIFDGFVAFLEETRRHGFGGHVWIGGSFVSAKETPSDIDVLLLITKGPLLPWKTRVICFNGPVTRKRAKRELHCDPFVIDCRSDVAHLPHATALWVQHLSTPTHPGEGPKRFFEIDL